MSMKQTSVGMIIIVLVIIIIFSILITWVVVQNINFYSEKTVYTVERVLSL